MMSRSSGMIPLIAEKTVLFLKCSCLIFCRADLKNADGTARMIISADEIVDSRSLLMETLERLISTSLS